MTVGWEKARSARARKCVEDEDEALRRRPNWYVELVPCNPVSVGSITDNSRTDISWSQHLMSSAPLVSVGLFVYNGERFIEQSLRSILNQTFTDFELIISDNASTDRTGEIAQTYAERDKRIRYYRSEKNMGAGWNARRVCELATGKYFKWAAVDDLLEPDLLLRCVEILECDLGCVVAYARTKEVDENGKFIKNYITPIRTDYDDPVARFGELMDTGGHMCYQIFGVMRMSALRQLPPQGSYVNGDGVLLARLSLCGRFYEVPEYLFISRRHRRQSMATVPARVKQPRRFRLTAGYGLLPCAEWWDPTKARALTFPEFRLLLEYFLSIYRAPLNARQKLRCYSMLLIWIRWHYRGMLKDLLIAADQLLYNLQVAKTV
jgi:glycosyltransferase involved in cell wall biosynthesis